MRLYRFEGADTPSPVSGWVAETDEYRNMMDAAGRWFADSLDEALWYRCDHEDGRILFIDVDDGEAEQWRVSNIPLRQGGRDVPDNPAAWSARPEREFFLPRGVAKMAMPLSMDGDPEMESAALQM
jgi:hypothetical protein